MTLLDLQKRARAIRSLYAQYEERKYGRQWSGVDLAAGFAGDVGDLIELVQAKEGIRAVDDADAKLAHELADCLWSVLVLADRYGVDLETSFTETMDMLEKRIAAA